MEATSSLGSSLRGADLTLGSEEEEEGFTTTDSLGLIDAEEEDLSSPFVEEAALVSFFTEGDSGASRFDPVFKILKKWE